MSMLDDLNDLQDKYDNLLRKYKKLKALSRPSVVNVEEIEKQIDLELYISDYNTEDFENDYREYAEKRKRLAQAIYELYHPKAR